MLTARRARRLREKTWKAAERAICARLGGKRIPVTGRHSGDVPDGDVPGYAVEIKHRKALPAWLLEMARAAPCEVYFSGARIGAKFTLWRLSQSGVLFADFSRIAEVRQAPGWLRDAFEQAARASRATKLPPLVVLHQRGMRYDDCLCLQWRFKG